MTFTELPSDWMAGWQSIPTPPCLLPHLPLPVSYHIYPSLYHTYSSPPCLLAHLPLPSLSPTTPIPLLPSLPSTTPTTPLPVYFTSSDPSSSSSLLFSLALIVPFVSDLPLNPHLHLPAPTMFTSCRFCCMSLTNHHYRLFSATKLSLKTCISPQQKVQCRLYHTVQAV